VAALLSDLTACQAQIDGPRAGPPRDRYPAQLPLLGLAFLVPGVVGPDLPAGFAPVAAYGDFATGLLALLAAAHSAERPLFWVSWVAFNL
jgi:hypothetical protein